MAAETPAVENFSDDLIDSVAEQVVGGTTRDQMLGTVWDLTQIGEGAQRCGPDARRDQ